MANPNERNVPCGLCPNASVKEARNVGRTGTIMEAKGEGLWGVKFDGSAEIETCEAKQFKINIKQVKMAVLDESTSGWS